MRKDIKQLVNYYVKKFNTRNPYKLAECLNVEVQIGELGSQAGCYMFLKNHKCIFLNEDLEENEIDAADAGLCHQGRKLLFYPE